MSIKTRTDKEVAELVGQDEQQRLVLQITTLAYQINMASLADVTVTQAPTTLTVMVIEYCRNDPTIKKTLSLGGPNLAGITTAMLKTRLRQVAQELQLILDRGMAPLGGAA